jgi:hypothetical protein
MSNPIQVLIVDASAFTRHQAYKYLLHYQVNPDAFVVRS